MNKATPAVGDPSFVVLPGVALGSFLEPSYCHIHLQETHLWVWRPGVPEFEFCLCDQVMKPLILFPPLYQGCSEGPSECKVLQWGLNKSFFLMSEKMRQLVGSYFKHAHW